MTMPMPSSGFRQHLDFSISALMRLETIADVMHLILKDLRQHGKVDLLTVALETDGFWEAHLLENGQVQRWNLQRDDTDLLDLAYTSTEPISIARLSAALGIIGLECPQSAITDQTYGSWLGVPLRVGQRMVGVLTLHAHGEHAFDQRILERIKRLCEFVALKLSILGSLA